MAEYKRKSKENPTTKSMKTVRSHIDERTFSQVYLLFGEESYLVNQYRDMLIHALVNEGDTMNFTSYNADSFSVNSIAGDMVTMPFLAEYRVVLVENSGLFDKSDETLLDFLQDAGDSNILIFTEQKVDKRKKVYTTLSKMDRASCLEFKTPDIGTLSAWIGSILSEGGLKVRVTVPEKLISAVGSDMNTLKNEATKLHDYAMMRGEITDKDATDGKVKRGVDFTRLKQMLSSAIQPGREHYGFDWVGKKAAIVEANKPIRKTLRPCKEESKDWDITQNLYIEGDNLEALKILQESYLGKIKMIYIDPPYNTGDDYIYHDEFKMDTENYKEELEEKDGLGNRYTENMSTNGRYHSDWCNMIYPRLLLARNLLSDDGIIFVSIDYHENAALRICLDEIFGESNFVGEIYWESKTKSQNTKTSYDKLQPKAEMILVYGKNGGKKRFNLIT